jgi:hypothetical protein
MSASERAITVVVREWVEKAENDLKNAALAEEHHKNQLRTHRPRREGCALD